MRFIDGWEKIHGENRARQEAWFATKFRVDVTPNRVHQLEIKDWLAANGLPNCMVIKRDLASWRETAYAYYFETEDDALVFKLAWGGR